ncbi:probable phosphoglycerate mutase [Thermosulfidibacter takaii ABI70S6]|uniref:Probable phosphoglycerate mutase n=1 Tax=Thermosulfidibacter takaii (strain DSM 17441 / JCM 13301 / NBRC 103674 / ABI70S6) TaxID=1298851 RepID=A0A0S3QS21_THET7|nr:histidine phosphatase family protein [Thermosulfidibacter takaii]BAT71089.1 probable phosphoglycerate mutase [Thermosulfidibacter takaii ABI70S6]
MLVVKLIRHGESEFNKKGIIQGHTNSPLSPLGRVQAELTGMWLKEQSNIQKIYTSPLRRALETAQIINKHLQVPLIEIEEFKEIKLGIWEGKSIEEVKQKDPTNLNLWFTEPAKARIEGAERLDAFQKRVTDAFYKIVEEEREGEIAIVAHGGTISAIIASVLNLDMNHIWRMRFNNTSISEIVFGYQVPKVTLLNSTFHLGALAESGISIWNLKNNG